MGARCRPSTIRREITTQWRRTAFVGAAIITIYGAHVATHLIGAVGINWLAHARHCFNLFLLLFLLLLWHWKSQEAPSLPPCLTPPQTLHQLNLQPFIYLLLIDWCDGRYVRE